MVPGERLQTDADRELVIDGLRQAYAGSAAETDLDGVVPRLSPRWFVEREWREGVMREQELAAAAE